MGDIGEMGVNRLWVIVKGFGRGDSGYDRYSFFFFSSVCFGHNSTTAPLSLSRHYTSATCLAWRVVWFVFFFFFSSLRLFFETP
jgi:hypothetical protein